MSPALKHQVNVQMLVSPLFGGPFADHLGALRQALGTPKKKVCFADDRGLALEHVRVMKEPSGCPPKFTDEFLARVLRGQPVHQNVGPSWQAQFAQPAADYLNFRDKLSRNCVCLENVILREGESTVSGTIKVKNIAFDKRVFVRATFDSWETSSDFSAVFVPQPSGLSAQYDTFSFAFEIPSKCNCVEFCVGFRCAGSEFWDSMDSKNYKIAPNNRQPRQGFNSHCNDALRADLQAWSEFASWNHLVTDQPYW